MTNDEKILLEKIFRELQDIKVILQENSEFNDSYIEKLKQNKIIKDKLLNL
ncbi:MULTISPECIES: hypothetical protein [Clostridium]|uniref:Uncharacterized protein n=1 Tax=Clostridium novyi (strain NT) TaxID=386415 RepID=A0PZF1_CLONN|nr:MULTISPECIES: hypothetical protein [Clostridium]ABK61110.1 hypothetical protein NT01CX_1672 [Clostridium novyi NT]